MNDDARIRRSDHAVQRHRMSTSSGIKRALADGPVMLLLMALIAVTGCAAPRVVERQTYAPSVPYNGDLPRNTGGAIYHTGYSIALFEDVKARQVGDILTILLQESTSASKQASTATSKDTSVTNANPTLFGRLPTRNGDPLFETSIDGHSNFQGDGSSSQSNSLVGSITVSVAQVLSNGNLVVRGEKWLTLNQGEEFVQISGIVRPTDISTANTIASGKVADARIIYSGKGAVADSNRSGWLARFFNSPWMPF